MPPQTGRRLRRRRRRVSPRAAAFAAMPRFLTLPASHAAPPDGLAPFTAFFFLYGFRFLHMSFRAPRSRLLMRYFLLAPVSCAATPARAPRRRIFLPLA